jgi:signal transduction histidine kinase
LVGIAGLLLVNGLMRFGSSLGVFQAIGVLVGVGIALYQNPSVGEFTLLNQTMMFVPGLLLVLSLAVVSGLWSYWRDENNSGISRKVRKQMRDNDARLASMHERTQSIAELGARLNATFDYDKILDVTLDIGHLSLRNNPKHDRIVSLVLLVADESILKIETSRGVNYLDVNRTFRGEQGILAHAFEKGEPLIENVGETDPELGAMVAFKNIVSTLVIPLRAGYETYGAVIYGSTNADAFNGDTLDTLKAIAMQATVSLHNSVLYHSLREEKERIIAIEERARQELVRDLHDVPTQTMSAVAMRVGNLKRVMEKRPDMMGKEITTIHDMAKRATDEIRHVMFSLRPLSLETQGLTVALKQLVEKAEKTYGQKIATQISPYTELLLDDKQQGTLFYLIEEAVNNARKYANASLVRVIVTLEEGAIQMRVVDNGDGFDTQAVGTNYENRGSFGMVNMRERADLIGGSFDLSSTPGVGTTITVTIPVDTSNLPVLRTAQEAQQKEDDSPLLLRPRKTKKKRYTGPLSPSK